MTTRPDIYLQNSWAYVPPEGTTKVPAAIRSATLNSELGLRLQLELGDAARTTTAFDIAGPLSARFLEDVTHTRQVEGMGRICDHKVFAHIDGNNFVRAVQPK